MSRSMIFKASIVLYLFSARLHPRTRLHLRPILLQAPVTVRHHQATVPRPHLTLLLARVTGSYRKRLNTVELVQKDVCL